MRGFLNEEVTQWQYTHGTRNPEAISPDNWAVDMNHLGREGNQDMQLKMFYDYRKNIELYPEWQAYLSKHQPPTLVVWGKNDTIAPLIAVTAPRRLSNHLPTIARDERVTMPWPVKRRIPHPA